MPTPLSTPPAAPQTTITPASPPSAALPYSPQPFPPSSSSHPSSRPSSPSLSLDQNDHLPRARTTSALALMHAGLGLLSLPPTPGLEDVAGEVVRESGLEWGHTPRSPRLSFALPGEGATRWAGSGEEGRSGKVLKGDAGRGGEQGAAPTPAPAPTMRKTSGPRAFLRRAKSFGTSPLLGSTSFFSSSPSSSNAPTPSTSSSHLPPSPPLPSPPLPRHATSSSPHPSISTVSVKGKERARTTTAEPLPTGPQWLSTAGPLSPPPGASFSSSELPSNAPTRRAGEGPRKATTPVRRGTFSLFRRNDPSPAPVPPPSAETTPASSFDLPRSSSPQPISNLPSLPSFQLSSSYRMSWTFGSSPPPSASSPAPSPATSNRSRSHRPHSSNGGPSSDSYGDGSQLASSPSEERREEQVGLGFDLGGGEVARSPSTRVGRSHSDVGPSSPSARGVGRPQSAATSPLRAAAPLGGGFFATSPSSEKDRFRPPSRPSLSRRPSTSGGVMSAVSGFFGGGSGSSASNMARSGSAGAEASEFGTLFDGKGRKRGMSVGNVTFGGSEARKRAGSSSSLSQSWVPPSGSESLLVPTDGGVGTSSMGTTGRSRTSTDGRRFSFSSNASSQSSLLPSLPSPHFLGTPPGSPTMTRKSSELGLRDNGESRKASLSAGTRTRPPSIMSLKIEKDELPELYVERLVEAVKKSEIARILASSSDAFHVAALARYLSSFDFHGDPLDIALRKFLMEASLPPEAQQIDRTMEAFAIQYNLCNPGLFASSDTPYVLAFSMVMLSTDQFNPSNKNKMNKADYCKNTKIDGVSSEVLEYFFDQITITPFVFVEDDVDINGLAKLELPATSSFFSTKSGGQKEKSKLDPYLLIARGLTHDLRVNIESTIPFKSPFSFTGTTSFFNATTLHHAFARAPILQITARPRNKSSASEGAPLAPATSITTFSPSAEKGAVSSLKITKIGLLSRKEDLVEGGKKAASRKWKGWSVILTGSQLLFFKDPGWAETLQKAVGSALAAESTAAEDHHVVVFPPVAAFKPDAVLSLANSAAIYDSTYSKYKHVFRLVAPAGRQYLFQARDEDDLNSWLAHINYAASFKSAAIRMRGLTPKRQSLSLGTPGLPLPPSPVRFSSTVPHTSFASSSGATDSTRDDTLTLFDPPLQPLSPVTEEDSALPVGLEEALKVGVMETPRPRGENGEFAFPRTFSGEMKQGDLEALSRQPASRADMLRNKIGELETLIRGAKSSLHTDLRMARNLAVLTPFLRSTRDRISATAVPIEKRVRYARMNLAKLVCHREVLARDLLVEDREAQRSKKASQNRHSSNSPSSPLRTPRPNDSPWSPPPFSQPPARSTEPFADDSAEQEFFDSGVDDYAGALTDDELDRLRAAPPMQRSTTETLSSGRFRAASNAASEDEFPPQSIQRSPSPSLSHHKCPRPSTSLASLAPSGDLGSEFSEDVPLASPFPTTTELPEEEEEAEQWANTRGAKRVSLIAYETLDGPGVSSLIKIREERRSEGAGEE